MSQSLILDGLRPKNGAVGGGEEEFSSNGLRRIGLRLELSRATNFDPLKIARY
jgi:hypothetical protein